MLVYNGKRWWVAGVSPPAQTFAHVPVAGGGARLRRFDTSMVCLDTGEYFAVAMALGYAGVVAYRDGWPLWMRGMTTITVVPLRPLAGEPPAYTTPQVHAPWFIFEHHPYPHGFCGPADRTPLPCALARRIMRG